MRRATLLIPCLAAALFLPPADLTPAPAQPAAADCGTWQACRDAALQAREAGDHERFHDLAWRAVQKRGRRDSDLMLLLARAQSLSGRPGDALVTLRRLAEEMGVAHDVSGDGDFRRVRTLPGWPDVRAVIEAAREGRPAGAASSAGGHLDPESSTGSFADRRRAESSSGTVAAEAPAGTSLSTVVPSGRSVEVARFAAPRFDPGGLAYDAVSRRFVIGNLPERKLTIVAEGTNRAATLSGDAARLLDVQAIEIDRRRGDLWVVSAGAGKAASALHKLQLVSGRVLDVYTAPAASGATRFVDIAVGARGVVVLDAEGPRLFAPGADGRSLERLVTLPKGPARSVAPAGETGVVYIAYADRLMRVDVQANTASRVTANGRDLDGFERIRWHRGSLAGIRLKGDSRRIVRVRLDREGARAVAIDSLDEPTNGSPGAVAIDLLGDEFYYLVPGAREAIIRRVRLR